MISFSFFKMYDLTSSECTKIGKKSIQSSHRYHWQTNMMESLACQEKLLKNGKPWNKKPKDAKFVWQKEDSQEQGNWDFVSKKNALNCTITQFDFIV